MKNKIPLLRYKHHITNNFDYVSVMERLHYISNKLNRLTELINIQELNSKQK